MPLIILIFIMLVFCSVTPTPLQAKGVIQDGLAEFIAWPGMTLDVLASYKDLQKDGFYHHYVPSGNLKSQLSYRHGKLHGVSRVYGANGALVFEQRFKRGLPEGKAAQYYPDGRLKSEWFFCDHRLEGIAKFFLPDGTLRKAVYYEKGRIVTIKYYSPQEELIAVKH